MNIVKNCVSDKNRSKIVSILIMVLKYSKEEKKSFASVLILRNIF